MLDFIHRPHQYVLQSLRRLRKNYFRPHFRLPPLQPSLQTTLSHPRTLFSLFFSFLFSLITTLFCFFSRCRLPQTHRFSLSSASTGLPGSSSAAPPMSSSTLPNFTLFQVFSVTYFYSDLHFLIIKIYSFDLFCIHLTKGSL